MSKCVTFVVVSQQLNTHLVNKLYYQIIYNDSNYFGNINIGIYCITFFIRTIAIGPIQEIRLLKA